MRSLLLLVAVVLPMTGCETIPPAQPVVPVVPAVAEAPIAAPKPDYVPTGKVSRGKASYYSIKTNGGTATASGQRLSNSAQTAAHRTLPMGTRVRVTNLSNGKSQIVRINDRGPFIKGRIIDVTIGVGRKLGMIGPGVVPCKVEVLKKSE